jgi:hypothetical protein
MARSSSSRLLFTSIGRSEAKMLGVKYRFVQETGHMMVVEGVGGVAPTPLAGHEP